MVVLSERLDMGINKKFNYTINFVNQENIWSFLEINKNDLEISFNMEKLKKKNGFLQLEMIITLMWMRLKK